MIKFEQIMNARKNLDLVNFGDLYSYSDIEAIHGSQERHWATVMINEEMTQFVVYTTITLKTPSKDDTYLSYALISETSLDAIIAYYQSIGLLQKLYRELCQDPSITFAMSCSPEILDGTVLSINEYLAQFGTVDETIEIDENTEVDLGQ